nr:hypothetical protein [Tanacetum cinerariifolium]
MYKLSSYLAFGRYLDEIQVTWAHLEKKRIRLQTNTKTLKDLCSQSLETASLDLHDAVTTHTASQSFMTVSTCTDTYADFKDSTHDDVDLSDVASCDEYACYALENQLLYVSLLICLGKHDCVERIPSDQLLLVRPLGKETSLHQTFKKSSIAMTRKLDDMIELPKSQPKRTYNEDLECEIVMVKMPKCMAWLDDEPIEEVEDTIGIPMELEPLNHMKLDHLGLNTNTHDLFLSSNGFHSVDEPEPQLFPIFSPLDVNIGDKRGTDPPINPHSLSNLRMKKVETLTIHTPPSPHVEDFH